jgi:mannose-1-phosphate guanylyltransferase
MKAVILANEVGEKLWPLTNLNMPKALLSLYSKHSLLEETIIRTLPLCDNNGPDVFIATTKEACKAVKKLAVTSQFGIPQSNIISISEGEQSPENRFRLMSELFLNIKSPIDNDEVIAFIPSDQFFWPEEGFIFHMQNLISGLKDDPEQVYILAMQPGTPAINMNYIYAGLEHSITIGKSFPLNGEGDELNTPLIVPLKYQAAIDTESAEILIKDGWLWDLNTTVSSIGFLKKCMKKEKDQSLSGMFSNLIYNKQLKAVVATKVVWSMLDNWASIRYLTYEAGLFSPAEDRNLHLIESAGNLVKKKEGKEVVLVGVQDLVVIDTDDKLLIATPGALYEHF